MWRHYLSDHTAAESVNLDEVARRIPGSSVCRAPEPARRRRVVRRRLALRLGEADSECEHRFRQPSLGALGVPLEGVIVFLSRCVNTAQCKHSVRVPLPRRLLQKLRALLRLGLAPASKNILSSSVDRIDASRLARDRKLCGAKFQPYIRRGRSAARAERCARNPIRSTH